MHASRSNPTSRSRSYETALAHLKAPRLPDRHRALLEPGAARCAVRVSDRSERSEFSIHPRLEQLGLRTTTVLRFVPPDGTVRAFEYHGDAGLVRLDPRWHQAALRFVAVRFPVTSCRGIDHLLFLLCLVVPVRRLWPLVVIVTAFTVAHSITLIAAALRPCAGRVVVSAAHRDAGRAVDPLSRDSRTSSGSRLERRWMIAFAFGLVHGFAFSFELTQTLQFAGEHLLTALLSFNLGVELGQILVLASADSAARDRVPPRYLRARGHDSHFGVRRSHGVALDARARRNVEPVSVACTRCRGARDADALADGARRPGWVRVGYRCSAATARASRHRETP